MNNTFTLEDSLVQMLIEMIQHGQGGQGVRNLGSVERIGLAGKLAGVGTIVLVGLVTTGPGSFGTSLSKS